MRYIFSQSYQQRQKAESRNASEKVLEKRDILYVEDLPWSFSLSLIPSVSPNGRRVGLYDFLNFYPANRSAPLLRWWKRGKFVNTML